MFMKQLISQLKALFQKLTDKYKPVYRIDVLRYAKKHKYRGICQSLHKALDYYQIYIHHRPSVIYSDLFPAFNLINAEKFGATGYCFWWEPGVWDTGREAFLDWLIEQYKDDKTDLKTLQLL